MELIDLINPNASSDIREKLLQSAKRIAEDYKKEAEIRELKRAANLYLQRADECVMYYPHVRQIPLPIRVSRHIRDRYMDETI